MNHLLLPGRVDPVNIDRAPLDNEEPVRLLSLPKQVLSFLERFDHGNFRDMLEVPARQALEKLATPQGISHPHVLEL